MATSVIRIEGDGKHFFNTMDKVESKMNTVGSSIGHTVKGAIIGAVGYEVLKETVIKTMEWVEQLQQVSEQTGESKENLVAMQRMAERVGGSMETVQQMFAKTTEAFRKAAEDENEMHKLNLIGITKEMVLHGKVREALEAIAKLQKGKSATASTVAFAEVLGGRGLAAKATAMREGLGNFEETKQSGLASGVVPHEADIDALVLAQRQIKETQREFQGKAVPIIAKIFQWLMDTWFNISDYVELNATGILVFIDNMNIFKIIKDVFISIFEAFIGNFKRVLEDLKGGHLLDAISHTALASIPATYIPSVIEKVMDKNSGASLAMGNAEADIAEEQRLAREARTKARAAAMAGLHAEGGDNTIEQKNAVSKTIPSDSLISVGNYLGNTMGNAIFSVAEQQLGEQRATNDILQRMYDEIARQKGHTIADAPYTG